MKKLVHVLLTSSLLWASATYSVGQVTKLWDKTIGGSGNDNMTTITMVPTSDGGFLLGGSSNSNMSGDKTENRKGDYDYWVVKIDSMGNRLWDKTIGGNGFDLMTTMLPTADGGFLLGGTSSSNISGDKTIPSVGGNDYWVVKIDAMGNKLWDKTFGGNANDNMTTMVPTSDGGFLLGGHSQSDITFGSPGASKTENSKGSADYWVVKIDAMGKKLWDRTIGSSGFDLLNTIHPTTDGGFLLGGNSFSNISGDKTENSKGGFGDYWIVKIDAMGNKLWDKTIGGNAGDNLLDINPTADGGFLLGGASESNIGGDKTENSKGSADYWIVKIDAMGNKLWDKTFGGSGNDNMTTIHPTTDGGFLLGGSSLSNMSGDKTENSKGDYDYWVVKIDAMGNKLWDKTLGGSFSDYLTSIHFTLDGGVLLAGYSMSFMGGDKTENSKGNNDYWVVKIQESIVPPRVSVYPTAISDTRCVTVDVSDLSLLPATVTVKQLFYPYATVITQTITSSTSCVDVSRVSVPFGTRSYLLTITDAKGKVHTTNLLFY